MRQVAAEVNLSETAFARPLPDDAEADWDLRWFTPKIESRMCGHATLATTHAMAADGLLGGKVRFNTLSGILVAEVGADDAITLDFPVSQPGEIAVPEGLSAALGLEPVAAHRTHPLGDLLVELADEAAVRSAAPDLAAVAQLTERDHFRGLLITAQAADPDSEYDFVSRFFAPAHGIGEDPVTGSAHTGLAPYWAARLGQDQLVGFQASARGGLVRITMAGDRVYLPGRAVTIIDGDLLV